MVKHMSFKQKLLIIGMVPIVVLGTLMGYLSYTHARNTVIASQKGVVADTAYRTDMNLNTKVRYIMESVRSMAESAAARDVLGGTGSPEETGELEYYASSLSRAITAVSSVSLLSHGELLFSTVDNDLATGSPAAAAYWASAERNPDKVYWSNLSTGLYLPREGAESGSVIAAYTAVCDETGEMVGLLVVEMSSDSFSTLLLENQNLLRYQYTYIVDRSGRVICSDKRVDVVWRTLINQRFQDGDRRFTFEWDGQPYYVCGQYNAFTGWRTFSVISVDHLFPQADALRTYNALLIAGALLLMLLFIFLLYRSLTKPLNDLSKAMKTVQEHHFELQLPNEYHDEIGRLTDSFNQMVHKINSLIREVYQEKLAQKNAELEALQAQINPHFLYNTLDSVNWMAIEHGEMDISRIVVALGKLMQYSMDTEQAQATLEQEYAHLEDYLCVQKNRLESRLEYRLEMDEQVREVKVPKLILQPLVENAIKHGIEPCGRPGTVLVSSVLWGDEIRITVEDNGCGMRTEQLDAVRRDCDDDDWAGIGLRNVVRRIKLYFGDRSRLVIQSTPNQGTVMTLILPAGEKRGDYEHPDH